MGMVWGYCLLDVGRLAMPQIDKTGSPTLLFVSVVINRQFRGLQFGIQKLTQIDRNFFTQITQILSDGIILLIDSRRCFFRHADLTDSIR